MFRRECTKKEINNLLLREDYGTLGSFNLDGSIYLLPLNFIYLNDKIYLHGKMEGRKIENIKNNNQVAFSLYHGERHKDSPFPCKTGTKYDSILIEGKANIINSEELKRKVLSQFSKKYRPELDSRDIDKNIEKITSVIEIEIKNITSKHHD